MPSAYIRLLFAYWQGFCGNLCNLLKSKQLLHEIQLGKRFVSENLSSRLRNSCFPTQLNRIKNERKIINKCRKTQEKPLNANREPLRYLISVKFRWKIGRRQSVRYAARCLRPMRVSPNIVF